MKFFTPEWLSGDTPEEEAGRIPAVYESHIRELMPPLPDDARRLVHDISLHDGLLRRMTRSSGKLALLFRAGDNQTGYFDARLSYGGGEVMQPDERFLRSVVGQRDVELVYDEFDSSANGCWIHRLLFWPYREVTVQFTTFKIASDDRLWTF